jgi:NADH dehydrogenase [ubiquinone] 1 alpha subcomplex assembly factor 7
MTRLVEHVKGIIRAHGPIPIAEFMRLALTARADSYYMRGDPFGRTGDFVTAPEIGQVFGELIGVWCVDVWRRLGSPARLRLVEMGPGRGTLMKDALRAARVEPAFVKAADVVLVEVSPTLCRAQKEALARSEARSLAWCERIEDVGGEGPLVLVANELFDALPIRQFVRGAHGWFERCVGLDGDEGLILGAAPEPAPRALVPASFAEAPIGAIFEIAPAREAMARTIGERLAASSGAALVIDYGFAGPSLGDTLQAVRRHGYADVLRDVGEADLTSHVDFTALAAAFAGCGARLLGPVRQGEFLDRLGARERTAALKRHARPEQAAELDRAYARLTSPRAMGEMFKVLCAFAPETLKPAGFETP